MVRAKESLIEPGDEVEELWNVSGMEKEVKICMQTLTVIKKNVDSHSG